eukprot:m.213282 g.213282  ORF g.213282 m.213282 type:complete len:93 (+) comp25554_c0_seq1:416-694(+)
MPVQFEGINLWITNAIEHESRGPTDRFDGNEILVSRLCDRGSDVRYAQNVDLRAVCFLATSKRAYGVCDWFNVAPCAFSQSTFIKDVKDTSI